MSTLNDDPTIAPICAEWECMNPATGTRTRTEKLIDNGAHPSHEPVCDEHTSR